jgi:hypothetical protein
MPLRKLVDRITKPTEDLDRERLAAFVDGLDLVPLDALPTRAPIRFGGEVSAIRLVPRAGAPALEVTVKDGRGSVVLVFLGRHTIAGMSPGRRLVAEGVVVPHGPQRLVYNPWYRFLPR